MVQTTDVITQYTEREGERETRDEKLHTAYCPAAQTDDEGKKLLSSNSALAFQIRFK